MAQHLREGSVVDVYTGGPSGSPAYAGVTVTNITDSYVEFEWTDPATATVRVMARPWSNGGIIQVVTD